MIKIQSKQDCCGCAACVQRCPKHCILMKEDGEGFLYPVVDESVCIDCGLCEKVCPLLHSRKGKQPQEVFAAKNRDDGERMASSSGGIFIALAKDTLRRGGVVFGAVFDRDWGVRHTYAETLDGVRPMMGSKYVQSRVKDAFKVAEKFLKDGRKVLFTGTPCQIAGLHGYLRRDYPNLLSVDFLCHGVPSPGVWRRYLDESFFVSARRAAAGKNTVLSSSLKSVPVVTGIEFRDKKMYGWKKFSFVVRGESASKADKNSVLLSDIHLDNPFMKGFLSDLYLRPSCYRCRCKNGVSGSDITIADYWGVWELMPDFYDEKGVGLVLVNTGKGKDVFDGLDVDVRESTLADARRFNNGFKEEIVPHPKRKAFFDDCKNDSLVDSINSVLYVSPCKALVIRIRNKISRILK